MGSCRQPLLNNLELRWFDYSSERDINNNVEVLWITCSNWTWTFTWRLVDSSFVVTKYLKSSTEHSKLKKIHTHVRIILDFCHQRIHQVSCVRKADSCKNTHGFANIRFRVDVKHFATSFTTNQFTSSQQRNENKYSFMFNKLNYTQYTLCMFSG